MSSIVWNNLKSYDGSISDGEFNRLVDALQSIALQQGLNYTIKRTPAGTTILPGGKGGGGATCPFSVFFKAVSGDPDSLSVTISPGSVNQYVATNTFDSFTISKSGTYYVKAAVESDGNDITSWSLAVDSSEPDPQTATASSLPASFDVLIAIIKDGKAYKTISCGSIILTPTLAFNVDKDSAGPGESMTIPYYIWQVSVS